jgi:hypothetical protein
MPEDWTEKRIADARAGLDLINETASQKIAELLVGKLSEKELRPKELADVANLILAQVLGDKDKTAQ